MALVSDGHSIAAPLSTASPPDALAAPRDRLRSFAHALARSRGVHFVVLGAILFAIVPRQSDPSNVALTTRDLDAMHTAQAARMGVPGLSTRQAAEVDERAIEDEILYREALRLGLDKGDSVVRQHLVQKTLLHAEDMAGATRTPTTDDLRAYFASTRDRWTSGGPCHFIHVFTSRHDAVVALGSGLRDDDVLPPQIGEAFPSSRDVSSRRETVAAVYGDAFADAVFAQPVGAWGEPVESKFGWHRVKVIAREAGRPASFEEVRPALALEWAVDRRHKAIAGFLNRAFERYDVTIDGARAAPLHAGLRLGRRVDPSAED